MAPITRNTCPSPSLPQKKTSLPHGQQPPPQGCPHLLLVVVQADASVHGELLGVVGELVHLVIQVCCVTLTLLKDGLNVSVCVCVWRGGGDVSNSMYTVSRHKGCGCTRVAGRSMIKCSLRLLLQHDSAHLCQLQYYSSRYSPSPSPQPPPPPEPQNPNHSHSPDIVLCVCAHDTAPWCLPPSSTAPSQLTRPKDLWICSPNYLCLPSPHLHKR